MMDHAVMQAYVAQVLTQNGGEHPAAQPFRSRSAHCQRVYRWCARLASEEGLLNLNLDVLLTGAIFHDCGYNQQGIPHEEYGARIFREYAATHYIEDEAFICSVCELIIRHSDKALLGSGEISNELLLLMEADLLDEEGAMGIVTDCLTMARVSDFQYDTALDHLKRHAGEILGSSPMVTPCAQKYWAEKQLLVERFIDTLQRDTFL